MTVAQHGLGPATLKAPVDVTYLADTVIPAALFRGAGHGCGARISIIKKRTGMHESTIREFRIDSRGLTIGEPLDGFQEYERRSRLSRRGPAACCRSWASEGRAPLPSEPLSSHPWDRDAAAAALIKEAGYYANVCATSIALMHEIERRVRSRCHCREAIKTATTRPVRWLNDQPSWSDSDRAVDASGRRPRTVSGCCAAGTGARATSLSSTPFTRTTLVSIVGSAVGAGAASTDPRHLVDLTESESLLQTR